MASKYSRVNLVGNLTVEASESEIAASRRQFQNPYAHLNDRDSYSALRNIPNIAFSPMNELSESRKLLQDPDAYLDDLGGFTASQQGGSSIPDEAYPKLRQKMTRDYESLAGSAKSKRRHSDIEIERKAIDLQKRLWLDKTKIWSDTAIADPIDVLDPSVAFGLLGFDFELADTLGLYSNDGKQVEVAGMIDDAEKLVRISRQFPFDVRNFTAAHELGHALLHDARGLHRDRPLDGTAIARSGIEFEADRFATYFLMPSKVVRARFSQHFGTEKFFLNEATGFALARGNSFDPVQKCRTLRDLSRVLASVESYNGIRFRSLASQFRVSVEAMAIRLEELELLTINAD